MKNNREYKFNFNTKYATDLRNAVNDRQKQSVDVKHSEKEIKGDYLAWDRICTIMDRLEDTLDYLNNIELGNCVSNRSAFDFYDFINNCFVIIDCIKKIGSIFRLDKKFIENIEGSNAVFGINQSPKSKDGRFFEYIRSLCSVHPLCTNRQKEFLNGNKFHCCPFVVWNGSFAFTRRYDSDLEAWVYTSEKNSHYTIIPLYISQFESYLNKWIDLIPKIIEAKNKYTDNIYEELKKRPVKTLADYDNCVVAYLAYLKTEYCNRFDYGNEYIFDEYIRVFSIKLTDKRNNELLEKYQNAIEYSLKFLRNELQNMSYEGYENNGIKYPDRCVETTLFDSLSSISTYDSKFSKYGYEIEKMYYLEPYYYDYADKYYARKNLEAPKSLINEYVYFTNTEPDEERIVLVNLALYLDSLTRKCLLNKNIPNFKKYRVDKLSKEEYLEILAEDPPPEIDLDAMKTGSIINVGVTK